MIRRPPRSPLFPSTTLFRSLWAVAAPAAIAATSADARTAVATRFVARVPRADDYLVRRLAQERLLDAAVRWGPVAPIVTGRTPADYRAVARRYLLPARRGGSGPQVRKAPV